MPGIITITPRARYYAFYSWLLVEHSKSQLNGMGLAEFVRRREQIFVLANLAWIAASEQNQWEGGLLGSVKLGKHWHDHREAELIPLSVDRYLQARYGGYGQYVGVMRTLRLIREEEAGILEVLPKGQELAHSYAEAIKGARYYAQRATFDAAESIPRDVLEEYGEHCHLGGLSSGTDQLPTLEALFALDVRKALPTPGVGISSIGNMKGSLGVILDMVNQTLCPLTDDVFRRMVAFGLCADSDAYRPSEPLQPFVAHWRMFQLREYFVYALYALWAYFLYWLRLEGPQTFEAFHAHLDGNIDLSVPAEAVRVSLPSRPLNDWTLTSWLGTLLDAAAVPQGSWESRCQALAQKSVFALNEHALYLQLHDLHPKDGAMYVGTAWLLLSILYLRFQGLEDSDLWNAWHWARFGGARRRSLHLFVGDMNSHLSIDVSVLDALASLYRDYIVAQHIITALEKWRQRGANTFHFEYERGIFEWRRDGYTGLSASRFRQAYTMLADLGLLEIVPDSDSCPQLTHLGQGTLQRVLEACDD
jgi:hypothetical protein